MLKFCAKIKELVNYEYLPLLNAPGVKFKVGHLPFVQICCLFGPLFSEKKVVFPLFFFLKPCTLLLHRKFIIPQIQVHRLR